MTGVLTSPQDAEAAFYRAFADRDLDSMHRIWADSPQTMCIHPGGSLLRGTADILQSWNEILSNAVLPDIHYQVLHSQLSSDVSIHTVQEAIRPAHSEKTPTIVISTNIYQKLAAGWHIIIHHASLPLVDRNESEPARNLH